MADMERDFRAAMDTPDVETASEPAMMGGDTRCPMCGADAAKILQGAAPPPSGGMGGGMIGEEMP